MGGSEVGVGYKWVRQELFVNFCSFTLWKSCDNYLDSTFSLLLPFEW
jgi:hypothetical protein